MSPTTVFRRSHYLNSSTPTTHTNLPLLTAAKSGDEHAFAQLTQPHQRELHIHCYRMLGTLHDADDALQETLLRAWRQLNRFEPHAPIRAWLYRIATNVCLTILERRSRRGEVPLATLDTIHAGGSDQEGELMPLQPYPDHLLTQPASLAPNPEFWAEQDESVALAFVAAVQILPARQRAALLLRDVIGYSAAEVAEMLETSVAAVNSALQRARAALNHQQEVGTVSRAHLSPGAAIEQVLVSRLVEAWQAADIPAIVAILTEDALFSMPPLPEHYVGREAIAAFLATVPAHGRLDRFRLLPTRANRQPAAAVYLRHGDDGPFHAHGLLVIAFSGDSIASLTVFRDPDLVPRFGLPLTVED